VDRERNSPNALDELQNAMCRDMVKRLRGIPFWLKDVSDALSSQTKQQLRDRGLDPYIMLIRMKRQKKVIRTELPGATRDEKRRNYYTFTDIGLIVQWRLNEERPD